MKYIEVFTGNRAEFGILLPVIEEFSKEYKINLIVSGAHLMGKWETFNEIEREINRLESKDNIKIVKLEVNKDENQNDNLEFTSLIYKISQKYLEYKKIVSEPTLFCMFLGDRIETAAYAFSAFYLNNILIHLCGGDLGNAAAYDHSIRHALTKISHLHLVTNLKSAEVVSQLGEEEWRIADIGMPSLDITLRQALPDKNQLMEKFNLASEELVIATYHPEQYISTEDNLASFKKMIEGLKASNKQVILTYPNNDPGCIEIIREIETNVINIKNIKIVKNLGIDNYIGLLNNLKVVLIGNTSSIITESPYYCLPSMLLGNRQKDRYRGSNVLELTEFKTLDVTEFINNVFSNYDKLKDSYKTGKDIYGTGNSSRAACEFVKRTFKLFKSQRILTKHFVLN